MLLAMNGFMPDARAPPWALAPTPMFAEVSFTFSSACRAEAN